MSHDYWDRLRSAYLEMLTAGEDHPYAIYPDQELEGQLNDPVPEEADYVAPSVHTQDRILGDGAESFNIRIYSPEQGAPSRPLFVWLHGGAFAFGDLDGPESDVPPREVATRAGAVVISVDYRLARDGVHFPVPLDDAVTAFQWASANALDLGADPQRVVLGGASAGGNLAAAAVLRLLKLGERIPDSLVLAYPALHPELPAPSPELAERLSRMSIAAAFGAPVYTPIVENYTGASIGEATELAWPGLARNLAGFPPTYIFNCEYDGLRASGERFAEQLVSDGVDVVSETVLGVGHGHLARPGLPQAVDSNIALAEWVRKVGDRPSVLTSPHQMEQVHTLTSEERS